MKHLIVIFLFAITFHTAHAKTNIDFKNITKIINNGDIYNIQILFTSPPDKENTRYIVAHYGGYDSGYCSSSGPCGCASKMDISILQLNSKNELKLLEKKHISNDCGMQDGETLTVFYNNQGIYLMTENKDGYRLKYYLDKESPQSLFQEKQEQSHTPPHSDNELTPSYLNDEPYRNLSPGFDCKKASNYLENQICSSLELSELDAEMTNLYKKTLKNLNDLEADKLKNNQIKFNNTRIRSCEDIVCIKSMTESRIKTLTNWKNL